MKTRSKALLISLCAVLLIVAAAFGTIAYFTDSDKVENTFTVGNIEMTLDEQDVDDTDEDKNTTERDKENKYHLVPGQTYVKDPTVHIQANSEDCYVFITVANGIEDLEPETGNGYQTIADQMKENGWLPLGETEYNGLQVFYYKAVVKKNAAIANLPVFAQFKVDGQKVIGGTKPSENPIADKVYLGDYADAKIIVNAYAVQYAGFENVSDFAAGAAAAWEATFGN